MLIWRTLTFSVRVNFIFVHASAFQFTLVQPSTEARQPLHSAQRGSTRGTGLDWKLMKDQIMQSKSLSQKNALLQYMVLRVPGETLSVWETQVSASLQVKASGWGHPLEAGCLSQTRLTHCDVPCVYAASPVLQHCSGLCIAAHCSHRPSYICRISFTEENTADIFLSIWRQDVYGVKYGS